MLARYAWGAISRRREPAMSTASSITRPTPAEPAVLDDDMIRTDIIDVLRWLQFPRKGTRLIELDAGVRDFIVRALRDR
jgi:hypothetical protein